MLMFFIALCMAFFVYVETSIVISSKITLTEKLFSFACFLLIEAYYLMHLFEKMGL